MTGANGFIGRRLCRVLGEDTGARAHVRALVRQSADGPWHEVVLADLARGRLETNAMAGIDTVFHLAALTHAVDSNQDEAEYEAINVRGTETVLSAAKAAGVRRFVFVSSVKAMGEGGPRQLNESTRPRPTTAYGRTKRAAELLVLDGGWVPEPTVLRLPLVYGPGARGNLANMIDAVAAGRFPPPPRVSNRRSMVHVDDVVDAAMRAAKDAAAAGRVFIVTDGLPYSTREIFEWICEALNQPVPRRAVPLAAFRALARAGDAMGRIMGRPWKFDTAACDKLFGSAYYDNTALCKALGFDPRWTLPEALPGMVAAMRP